MNLSHHRFHSQIGPSLATAHASENAGDDDQPYISLPSPTPDGVNALPYDIVFDIFLHACMTSSKRGFQSDAITLSHVCQRWRQFSLSSGILWSYVKFTRTSQVEWFEECIQRSGQCLLDITIDLGELPSSEITQGDLHAMLGVIKSVIQHVHRLRKFSAAAPSRVLEAICKRLEPVRGSVLEHLSLIATQVEHRADVVHPGAFSKGLPLLKELRINVRMFIRAGEDGQVASPYLPKSLRKVVLDNQTRVEKSILTYLLSNLLDALVLLSGSHIELLEIVGVDCPPIAPPITVLLDNVRAISVGSTTTRSIDQRSVHNLFTHLHAPVCVSLPTLPASMLPMIALNNPFPSLRFITIRADVFAPGRYAAEMLSGALNNMNELEEFRFSHFANLSSDLVLLFKNLAPRLTSLAFDKCTGFTSTDVRSVVEARRNSRDINALRSLIIISSISFLSGQQGTEHRHTGGLPVFTAVDDEWFSTHLDRYENNK